MNQNVFKQYSNRSNAMRAIKKAGIATGAYAFRNVEGSKAVIVVEVKAPSKKPTAKENGLGFPEALKSGGCPHCGDTSNGCTPNGKEGTRAGDNELYCHVCNTAFNATTGKRVAQRKGKNGVRGSVKGKVMPKGYHIEKVRETKNNVTRYSDGTVGAKIWDVLDMLPGGPKVVTVAQAAEACGKVGINATSAALGFYRWRRFHGQRGRVDLKKAQK